MKKLVILIPAFNVEKYIGKTLQSFLKQDCNYFDVIIVNDGSTDNTKNVILSFKDALSKKGIKLSIIDKENGGASSAINIGLKQNLNYEYILIMDGDDWLPISSISSRIEFLDNNLDYDCAVGATNIVDEKTNLIIEKNIAPGITDDKEKTFWNVFYARGLVFAGYIFRLKTLLSLLPGGQIYESSGGQNWQLLLPISYNCKIKVVPQETLNYLLRSNSHSREVNNNYEKIKQRSFAQNEILNNTLDSMGLKDKYQTILNKRFFRIMVNESFSYRQKNDFLFYYKKLKKLKGTNFKDFVKMLYSKILIKG